MACSIVSLGSPTPTAAIASPYDFTSKAKGLVPITGGPSSGKTTILNRLKDTGHFTFREAATGIIKTFQDHYGVAEPWAHEEFERLIVLTQKIGAKEFEKHRDSIGFMERSEVDPLTYRKFFGGAEDALVMESYREAVAPGSIYHKCAFAIAPLATFEDNIVRGQETGKPELGSQLFAALRAAYEEAGFEVVVVPPEAVEPRSHDKADLDLAFNESVRRRTNIILARCGLSTIDA